LAGSARFERPGALTPNADARVAMRAVLDYNDRLARLSDAKVRLINRGMLRIEDDLCPLVHRALGALRDAGRLITASELLRSVFMFGYRHPQSLLRSLGVGLGLLVASAAVAADGPVRVALFDNPPASADDWDPEAEPVLRFDAPALGFSRLPTRYDRQGLRAKRPPFSALRAETALEVPQGTHRLVLRARGQAQLRIDGAVVAETKPIRPNGSAHEPVPERIIHDPRWKPLGAAIQERVVEWETQGGIHNVELRAWIGHPKGRARPEVGALAAAIVWNADSKGAIEAEPGVPLLIAPQPGIALTDDGWARFTEDEARRMAQLDDRRRRRRRASRAEAWEARHAFALTVVDDPWPEWDADSPSAENPIDRLLNKAREAAGLEPNPPVDNAAFLRRLALDTIGTIPDPDFVERFLDDPRPDKRARAVEALLNDPRWADHWVGYWQDVLAENPRILKPTLNNTGPFRWHVYESFRDNVAFDRFVTELMLMQGGVYEGGPAAFGAATQNDVPMAAKAHVLAKAFLAADLKCARCHDAPFHPYEQEDLFGLAAMLANEPLEVPESSTVPFEEGGRIPAVSITLMAGDEVEPHADLELLATDDEVEAFLDPNASDRERLAARITAPTNPRFAQVIVNRVWKRYIGVGLVEPVDDWDHRSAKPSHPELLEALASDFVRSGYDLKALARRILTSDLYAAQVDPNLSADLPPEDRPFVGPARRRMSAEQILDSLFAAAGKDFGAEMLCLDPEGRRADSAFLNLGVPTRAWHFTSLSNERDRPALSLPVAQRMTDVLSAFGWRADRQDPITVRETAASPLQPAILANTIGHDRIARLSDDSAFTEMAIEAESPEALIEAAFLRVLSRGPTASESALMVDAIEDAFEDRVVPEAPKQPDPARMLRGLVSWSNHLSPEATRIQNELERLAQAGDPPTRRLTPEFRARFEDVLWALVNSPEFVFLP